MKNKKSLIILVILLVIGFATVSTTLVLNGVIGVSNKKEDFNIIFTNAKLDNVERKEFIEETTKQTITFETKKLTTLEESTTLEYVVANTSRLYDANVSVTCNTVDDEGNTTTSEYISMEYTPNNMRVEAGKTADGTIIIKLIKGSTEDKSIKVKCTLNATATEREELGSEYKEPKPYDLINDVNNNGGADIGDEIQVGTESFYVISITDTELNALAKYNLKVGDIYKSNGALESSISPSEEGYGKQDSQMRGWDSNEKRYGTVKFSNSNGWAYANNAIINIKDYEGPVKDALYGENGYENYIQKTIPKSSVRLITKGEIEVLINDGNALSNGTIKNKADAKGYSWLYYTSYWTQSAYSGSSNPVWRLGSDGYFDNNANFNVGSYFGVRPVITIPKA